MKQKGVGRTEQALFERGVDDGFTNLVDNDLRGKNWYYLKGVQAGKRRYRRFLRSPSLPIGYVVPPEPLPMLPNKRSRTPHDAEVTTLSAIAERASESRENRTPSLHIDLFRLAEEAV